MTTVKQIMDYMEELFPLDTALGFDNPGLNVGDPAREVTRVIVCLDATSQVVETAMNLNAEMVLAHHPLIFGGIKSVRNDDPKGHIIYELIRGGISCYSAHTNLDAADGFSNALLASVLGATEESITSLEDAFCGVVGELPEAVNLDAFCNSAGEALNASGVITYGTPETKVSRIFAQGGSFDEDAMAAVKEAQVDTVVAGEIKHHIMLELMEMGITGVIAGHNATERIFMSNLCDVMNEKFEDVEFVYFDGPERRF
ncbi:MAG: Nif3-like dinuclear metal center hexameric protein [Saccharofermentans sp.]|nr:Nif3-like dinuclear metal center hexameric protein [Saccharofermentans sp.]